MVFVRGDDLTHGCGPARGRVLVAVNKGATRHTITLPKGGTALQGCKNFTDLLGDALISSKNTDVVLNVPPEGISILKAN